MRATICTGNLRANPIRISGSLHCSWNLIVKAWPATVSLELAFRTIKRRTTALAHIRALLPKRVVLARERHLCALVDDNAFLFSA